MDQILAEIEKKRKAIETAKEQIGEKKYLNRGQLEKLREAEYLREQEQERQLKKTKLSHEAQVGSPSSSKNAAEPESSAAALVVDQEQLVNLDDKEIKARLRSRNHPIILFGETKTERVIRLQKIVSQENRPKPVTFKNLLEATEQNIEESLYRGSENIVEIQEKRPAYLDIDTRGISVELVKNDLDTACDLMSAYFKKLLKEWEWELDNRPDELKRTSKGKLEAITQKQTGEHLKPFWKGLKKRKLAKDILSHIASICFHTQKKDYMKANDAYIRLAIGNAPWPIGVTNSG